jgi:hypothetical protein
MEKNKEWALSSSTKEVDHLKNLSYPDFQADGAGHRGFQAETLRPFVLEMW